MTLSCTIRPVTHTVEVAVNSASWSGVAHLPDVEAGSINSSVPSRRPTAIPSP